MQIAAAHRYDLKSSFAALMIVAMMAARVRMLAMMVLCLCVCVCWRWLRRNDDCALCRPDGCLLSSRVEERMKEILE